MVDQKGKQLEEENYGLYARDLLASFCSKANLCDYLSYQSKDIFTIML
jgi:hypothetical protein